MPRFVKPLLILVPCVILALIVIIGCFDIVPAGYKGVKLTMGAVDNTVLNEGIHFKLPFAQRIVHVDARVKKYTVEGETSASKDMQSITTNVAVNYRVDGANVDDLYKNLSLNYENTIIAPAVSECIKSVTSQYTAEETITRRSEISAQIKDMLKKRLEDKYIFVDSLNIIDLTFSAAFDKAIEEKQVAEQNALKAKYDLERIKTEAEQAVIKAQGEAEAILTVQRATAEGIKLINESAPTDPVIKIKALEAFTAAANGRATKIIIPSEIQGLAGLAEGIVEAVKEPQKPEPKPAAK